MRPVSCAALCALTLLLPGIRSRAAAPAHFTETWESYATGATPIGPWELEAGSWGALARPDADGAGRYHSTPTAQTVWLRRAVDLSAHDHVVLQGWFYESRHSGNRSALGLASSPSANNRSLIRMGLPSTGGNYRLEYVSAADAPVSSVDTLLPQETGWHFMRLDLVRDRTDSALWNVTWRGWNAAATQERKVTFAWNFDSANVRWITLGSPEKTSSAVGWDDVQVGSLAQVGPPPPLPWATPKLAARASSFLPGWEPSKVLDGNSGTIFSSNGHGATAVATEWVAFDLGQAQLLAGVRIHPRPGGYCWPVDYSLESSLDMTTWKPIPGATFTGQAAAQSEVRHTFAAAVTARGIRLKATKLGPDDNGNRYLQIADFTPEGWDPNMLQAWASPGELRGKRVINAAQYSTLNLEEKNAPTPRFLAEHPEYLTNHPFDGLTVPLRLDRQWLTNQGLVDGEYALQDLVMTKLPIPWSQVSSDVDQLKRVRWAHVTDNFLWYRVSDASTAGDFDTRYAVDPASTNDWNVVARNAALCARICRETGLKGFMIDTEQYTKYASGEEYPFGRGTPATWRERGRQWIKAVQSEFPGVILVFFFSWGPESDVGAWPHYQNLPHFMNGILADIQSPGRIIHGWESTFWWGGHRHLGGDVNDPKNYTSYPGDRTVFAGARNDIKNVWRGKSDNPVKYDQFVEAGMAAYVDSDPYNLFPGWPSGVNTSWPWSNLPYTLAYSDSYVWVWAAHTHYAATRDSINPFMASIANRTFHTGREQVGTFTEDFQTEPTQRGWHFDYDILAIGRRPDPDHRFPFLPVMSLDSMAYAWSAAEKVLKVRANWTRGDFGETVGLTAPQRRRYVRPITPVTASNPIRATFDFTVESFGNDPGNPILLGLFHSAASTTNQSLALRVTSATDARIVVAGDGTPWFLPVPLPAPLPTGTTLRCTLEFQHSTRTLRTTLSSVGSGALMGEASAVLPTSTGPFVLDEAGVAQTEAAFATPAADAHRFRLNRFVYGVVKTVLSLPPASPDPTRPILVEGPQPGVTYMVQTSIDLERWSAACSFTSDSGGAATNEVVATVKQRLYRVSP